MLDRGRGALLVVVLVGAALADAARAQDRVRAWAAASNAPGRLVRIGLEPARRVTLTSGAPLHVLDPATGEAVFGPTRGGEIVAVVDGAPEGDVRTVYRVQVASFTSETAAEAERARLAASLGVPAVVRYVADRGAWRVRVGEAGERTGLVPLVERLRELGFQGIWIADEPAAAVTGATLRLVDADWRSVPTGLARLAVVPAAAQRVSVDGRSYRGIVELRVDASGRIRPINWIDLESYLRGVVPEELGPEAFPQIEALKAQAVAARTYALANEGQFADEGFDLCASPRCQVYGGAAAEHVLSDRAVLETQGEILTWNGRPANALYTSTCGGHTEDAANVFPEQRAPYLTGVPCRAEKTALTPIVVEGSEPVRIVAETGEDVTRDAALLMASGVIAPRRERAEWSAPPTAVELRGWTAALATLAGRPAPSGPPPRVTGLGETAASIVRDLGLGERVDVLLAAEDVPAVLRDEEAMALPDEERRALAGLAVIGALRPLADGRFGVAGAPSRARIAAALARVGDMALAFGVREGTVSRRDGKAIVVVSGREEIALRLADRPSVFVAALGRSVAVARLLLWPGDRVRWRIGSGGGVDLLEMVSARLGTSDDRSSSVYAWEVRRSRAEVETTINRRVAVGELRDLVVLRRGVSGRIADLRVVGTDGAAVVRGFDIRQILDLRESLTVIEIARDADGRVAAVNFAGKGWGHGVGLCQVGAFGMAVRGARHREILAHYYPGTRIEPVSP